MFELGYSELEYPCEWPPSEIGYFLPIQTRTHNFWRWPKRQLHQIRLNSKHRNTVKEIDRNISYSLSERPEFGGWPLDSEPLRIAKVVSRLLAEERALKRPPALHPNDPIPILFWDPFEGLMPMLVKWEFEMNIQIDSISVILQAMDEKWTMQSFLCSIVNSGR